MTNANSSGCDLVGGVNSSVFAHFVKSAPAAAAELTLSGETVLHGQSVTAGRFVSFNFPATFDNTKLDSLNGILNKEHGHSAQTTTGNPKKVHLGHHTEPL